MGLQLKIISPERIIFNGKVDSVAVPGTSGRFEVLQNHAPIISSLGKGNVAYKSDDGEQQLPITCGFIEVKENEVSLCVEL